MDYGIRVLDADDDGRVLRLTVETVDALTACQCCGVVARAHGRRQHLLHETPFGHRQVLVRWRKRVWRCDEPAGPTGTWTEVHALAEPRAVLINRAIGWATDALAAADTTASALARRAGSRLAHTGAINLIIEKTRRLAHGFGNFNHYRLRLLLVADGRRPYPRRRPRHA